MHIPAPHLRCLGQGDASKEKKIIRVCIVHMIGVERCQNNMSRIYMYTVQVVDQFVCMITRLEE